MQHRRKITRVTTLAVLIALTTVVGTTLPAGAKGEPFRTPDPLLDRETDGAVTIRAALGPLPDDWGPGACDAPGCMPKPCRARGVGWVGLSTRAAVGEGQFEIYAPTSDPATFAASGTFGAIVDHAVGWVVVRTGPKTAEVEASFRDGGRDSMRPVDGWAILAAPLPDVAAEEQIRPPTATVTARDTDGTKLDAFTIGADTLYAGAGDLCPTMSLPTRFPEATGRAPADEDAARAAISAAYIAAYSSAGQEAGLASVEDGAALAEVAKIAGDRFPEYAGKIHPRIDEVRFIDTDEAAVRFGLDIAQDPGENVVIGLSDGIGRAVFRSGRWLVGRSTFCSLLAVGGTYCPLPKGRST